MRADIERVRQRKLAKFCQVILLDKRGRMIESCNSIFDANQLKSKKVEEWFPFVESVLPVVLELTTDDPELLFSKVENPASFLPGYYDFTFSISHIEGKEYILWEIYDFTTLYEDFRHYQQKRNELEIQRQILALQNKKLRKKEDIHKRGNLVFDSISKNNDTPLGSLDLALDAIMDFVTNNNDRSTGLLGALDGLSDRLKEIVMGLPGDDNPLEDSTGGTTDKNIFSLENILYDAVQYISSDAKDIRIIEAGVAEDLPVMLLGNSLDLKRVIVGLATNIGKLYADVVLKIHLYLQSKSDVKCVVGVQVLAVDGKEQFPPIADTILRTAVIKKIVEMHQGNLELENTPNFGSKIKCSIPFHLV